MFNNINEASREFKGMILAVESMMSEGAVEDLLASAQSKINASCKTVDDCDSYLANIENETEKYNNALNEIKLTAEELKNGQIDQETFAGRVKPYMAELKNSCDILDLAVGNSDTEGLSDSDIVNLKTFLIGVREIILRRREELSRDLGGDTPNETLESLVSFLSGNEIVIEGKIKDAASNLKAKLKSKKKEASELVEEARDDIKSDDLADATRKLSKAKKVYQDIGRQFSNLKEWSKKQVSRIDALIAKVKDKMKRKSKAATESFFDYDIYELDAALEAALDEEVEELADEIVEEGEDVDIEDVEVDVEEEDDDEDEESLESLYFRLRK